MPAIPHLAFPFDVDGSGRVRTVEQDSTAEIAGCAAAVLSYPRGSRRGLPDFGLDPQVFEQGGPDVDEIRSALDAYEPRAIPALELDNERLADFASTVRVDYS